jgi:hypothetical protein
MAGAAGSKTRSSNSDNAEKLISIYNNISKIIYRYAYLRRIGSIYDALLCRDEDGGCDSLVIHGVLVDYESLFKSEIGDEAVINGRSVIYYQWDPCRSRRYLVLLIDQERGGDLDG